MNETSEDVRPPRSRERPVPTTAFAVRFRDHATGGFVSDGLTVEAYPAASAEARTGGRSTGQGVFVFDGLPGLPAGGEGEAVGSAEFVLEVRDRTGHFLPFTLDLRLPLQPPAGTEANDRPLDAAERAECLPLFSSSARPVPRDAIALRAEMVDVATGLPAAWAMVDAHVPGHGLVTGLADESGRLMLPLPRSACLGAGTAAGGSGALVDVSVRYRRREVVVDIPDLAELLSQPMARAWTDVDQTAELRRVAATGDGTFVLGSRGTRGGAGPLLVSGVGEPHRAE